MAPEIDFKRGDFIKDMSWVKDADVVFANATCFEKDMV